MVLSMSYKECTPALFPSLSLFLGFKVLKVHSLGSGRQDIRILHCRSRFVSREKIQSVLPNMEKRYRLPKGSKSRRYLEQVQPVYHPIISALVQRDKVPSLKSSSLPPGIIATRSRY